MKAPKPVRRTNYVSPDTNLDIGNRVRHLRINILDFKRQLDFARELGVSRGAVGNWELGRGIGRANLDLIAKTFNVSVDWLSAGLGAPDSEPAAGPTPAILDRARLLPPDDYERFWLTCEAILDCYLRFVQRQSVAKAGPGPKAGRRRGAKKAAKQSTTTN